MREIRVFGAEFCCGCKYVSIKAIHSYNCNNKSLFIMFIFVTLCMNCNSMENGISY